MVKNNGNGKIGIVGLGLIGGSIALALSAKYSVVGYDVCDAVCAYAKKHICPIVPIADMADCDIVFVCVPLSVMEESLNAVYKAVGDAAIITDVASVKSPFTSVGGRYVGGHPMAGMESGGIERAKAHLFENAYYILTVKSDDAKIVESAVKAMGALPLYMSAEEHDAAVSAFSHTPHAVAYALTAAATKTGVRPIAGSGFLDTTRIAQSDGKFWAEVLRLNSENVINGIDDVVAELNDVKAMMLRNDYAALGAYFNASREKRTALNRADLGGETLYVDLVDRVGAFEQVIATVTWLGINLKNIALRPGREGACGALMLEFETAADRQKAATALGIEQCGDKKE